MNLSTKQLICLTILASAMHMSDAATSKIVPRSQSFNAARQIVGWDNPFWGINRKPQDSDYASFNITFEYTRTFRDNRLAQCLFGNDLICTGCDDSAIKISGSAVPAADRGANDWLADYFGLPRDFQSTVSFKPSISNFILDFSFYAGLDSWVQGMYFRIHGPFVHTKWNLNAQECITQPGTPYNGSYFQGYFSSEVVPIENLNTSFLNYANGAVPTINNNYMGYDESTCLSSEGLFVPGSGYIHCTPLADITWKSLCCSKISPECGCEGQGLSRNGFGELRFVLGYNFIDDEAGDYHAGLGLYVAAPTGTKVGIQDSCNSKGRYLFEPIVGNGKHWELGAQVTAHHIFWRNAEEDKSLGLYIEANITHLFSANQIRCFDLCSAGSNSRYMLAEELGTTRNTVPSLNSFPDSFGLDSLMLDFSFMRTYAPVANLTRRNITSSIAAQGDVAFSVAYQSGNFQWDIGYNFWGRSCEQLNLNNDCCAPALGDWALKGDQRIYGFIDEFIYGPPDIIINFVALTLPATDSMATIHSGSNMRNGISYTGANPTEPTNFYADDSLLLSFSFPPSFIRIVTEPGSTTPLYTSEQPILIQESDFDLSGTRGISNKLFTHFNWAWPECKDSKWTPYIGIGAEVEFGSGNKGCCDNDCATDCNTQCPTTYNYPTTLSKTACTQLKPCCSNVALTQWGVWLKVGSSYN